jgi:hypothetical protein
VKKTFNDLSGVTFGFLQVIAYSHRKTRTAMWRCVCSCGSEKIVARDKLVRGLTVSCGCKRYRTQHPAATHGKKWTPEHRAWLGAKGRCFNPKNPRYVYYGERGITMCQEWKDNFMAFYAHIGPKPHPKLTLDRIDVDGNYEPGNVRWATWKTQRNNRRDSY